MCPAFIRKWRWAHLGGWMLKDLTWPPETAHFASHALFLSLCLSHFLFTSLCISDQLAGIFFFLNRSQLGSSVFVRLLLSIFHPNIHGSSPNRLHLGYPSMELCSTSAFYPCALTQKNWNEVQLLVSYLMLMCISNLNFQYTFQKQILSLYCSTVFINHSF